eukprot:CAMPEP_0113637598 /NCGR_PEP_ID=MMETSP0017_2-20120614/19686_1 /TAXON_ID=2856 /ORGANISM="Cylindrotheca closterium" /LENGTH=323 /DNA_ID=CAMNT_0000548645 /DNA_START=96 /DNA_END=1067 /DNA_ORIENTATION=- /assembly_acc=CAM_ASM_000147
MSSEQLITDKETIKSMISDRQKQLPDGQQQKVLAFEWISHPVSKYAEDDMARQVVKRGHYGSLTEGETSVLSTYIQTSSSEMTLEQAKSLRSALLQEKAMNRHFILNSKANEIAKRYKRGQGVLSLSNQYDCPPVNLFRAILSTRGYSKPEIKDCVQHPQQELNKRDRRELSLATQADMISNPDRDHAHEKGQVFEAITAKFLKDLGIAFVEQDDLVQEQLELFGKTIVSPDFLLLDEVTINGQSVKWIDAKAFYGANVKCRKRTVRRQATKYGQFWGNGAVLFLEGFCANLNSIDGCTFLSARDIMTEDYFQPLVELKEKRT